MIQNKDVKYIDLGLKDYQETWTYQESLFQKIIDIKVQNKKESQNVPTSNYLLTVEHPHVYTLGKSGKEEHLLLDQKGLNEASASYYKINRGGDITYHGPGQLVVYPIFDLDNFFTDIHKYMRFLEEAVMNTCLKFGIKTERINGLTGVWLNNPPRKICAMGVKSSRWVTMHGLALNVSPDLSYFNNIVPCGIDDKAVTSMKAESIINIEFNSVKETLVLELQKLFGFELL